MESDILFPCAEIDWRFDSISRLDRSIIPLPADADFQTSMFIELVLRRFR
jgi:hypothetical protein